MKDNFMAAEHGQYILWSILWLIGLLQLLAAPRLGSLRIHIKMFKVTSGTSGVQ